MSDIQELEQYFDELVRDGSPYPSEHALMGDKERFEFYDTMKVKLAEMADGLNGLADLPGGDFTDKNKAVLSRLSQCFSDIAAMTGEELDYCLRAIAVDDVLQIRADSRLMGMIEKLIALFFDDAGQTVKLFCAAMEYLKKKKDENQLAIIFDQIENSLSESYQGIIAKDKKMIETIRQMQLGVSGEAIDMAVKQTVSKKPKIIDGIVARGKIKPAIKPAPKKKVDIARKIIDGKKRGV